jgi:hypothetical protein
VDLDLDPDELLGEVVEREDEQVVVVLDRHGPDDPNARLMCPSAETCYRICYRSSVISGGVRARETAISCGTGLTSPPPNGLINRRSQVQILPPLLEKACFAGLFCRRFNHDWFGGVEPGD